MLEGPGEDWICQLTHSLTDVRTHWLTRSFTFFLTNLLIHSLTYSLTD